MGKFRILTKKFSFYIIYVYLSDLIFKKNFFNERNTFGANFLS